jgi:hypothetical protein
MINARINDTIRNLLTDHSVKLDKPYYRPTEDDMLQEYLKVVDALTINEENRLKRKVEQLTIRTDKLDQLATQVARLSKRMGLVEKSPREESGGGGRLDHITEQLRDNLGAMDYYDEQEHICCSCRIQYAYGDDEEKGDWYAVVNEDKTVFQCHRCHSVKKD